MQLEALRKQAIEKDAALADRARIERERKEALRLARAKASAEREERLKHKIERAKTQVTYVGVVWIRRALRTHMVRVCLSGSHASRARVV